MYRAGSFASSSALNVLPSSGGASSAGHHQALARSRSTDRNDPGTEDPSANNRNTSGTQELPVQDTEHVVYLKSNGHFLRKQTSPVLSGSGRLVTMWNYPLRNKLWSMHLIEFHPRTGSFVIANERGQVYKMSMTNFGYESIRLASTSVSSMCFLLTQKTHLIIAYENGTIVIIDTHSKDIIGNIQLPTKSTARLMKAHPNKDVIAIATEHNHIYLWDLTTCHAFKSMECTETIVDIRFEMQGKLFMVCLERQGVFLYSTESLRLLATLPVPVDFTQQRRWTAYTCLTYRTYFEEERKSKLYLNILLASNDNKLFSWYVGSAKGGGIQCHLFGAYDLPGKNQAIVNMSYLGDDGHAPRVALLSSEGGVLLVESEGFQEKSPGFLNVVGHVISKEVQYDVESYSTDPKHEGYHGHKQYPIKSAYAKMNAAKNYLVVVATDGAARLFDISAMLGNGAFAGKILKIRAVQSQAVVNAQMESSSSSKRGKDQKKSAVMVSNKENQRRKVKEEIDSSDEEQSSSPADSTRKEASHQTSTNADINIYDFYLGEEEEEEGGRQRKGTTGQKTNSKISSKGSHSSTSTSKSSTAKSTSSNAKMSATQDDKVLKPHAAATSNRTVKSKVHSFMTGNQAGGKGNAAKHDMVNMPLFELANLTPKEKRVNEMKLQSFLHQHGEYPSRYRPLIWRFLLKLPENSEAFADLVKRGIHPAFEDLQDTYPIQNRKLFTKLQQCCSQLTHWAPILSEATYLPSLIFPFTLIYNGDELACMETVMSIMMYWGYSWHATHPNPPVHIVDTFNNLLKLHDLKLYQYLQRLHIVPGILAWQMISTLFTEICSRTTWCALMDFLFTYFTNVTYMLLVPLAIIKDIKTLLYSVDTEEKIKMIFGAQQHIRVEHVLQSVRELHTQTPAKYFSGIATKYIDNSRYEIGNNSVKDTKNGMEEADEVKVNLALSNGNPKFPLPVGSTYPVYDGFPTQLIDMQIHERNKVLNLQKEMKRRTNVLQELEAKIQTIEGDHQQWLMKHQHATELMQKQRVESMQAEKQYLRELQSIEEEISSQRVRALEVLEKSSKEEMKVLDQVVQNSAQEVIENEHHLKEKMEMMLNLQKYREVAEKAEVATMEKIRELRMRRQREEWVKGVSNLLHHKEEEMTIQDRILYEKWQKQDTEKRLQRDHRQQELQEQVELSALDNIQQEIELKMKRLQMEREAKLMEVERLRSMRLAKEQSSEALESAERAALLLKKQQLLSNVVFTNDSSKARQDEDMLQSLLAQEQEKSKLKGIKPSSSEEALSKQAKAIQQRKQSLQQALQQINEESQQLLQAEQAFQLQQRKKEQEVKESMLYNDYLLSIQEIDDKMKTNEVELQDELHHLRYAKDLHSKQTMPIVHPTTSSANSGKTKKKVHMMDDEQEVPIRQEKAVSCSSMKETPSSSRGQSSSHVIPTNVGPVRVKNLSPENDDDTAVHDFDMNEDLLGKKSNHFTGEDEVEDVEMMPLDEAMNRASRVLLGSTTTRTVLDEDVDEEVFEDSLNSPLKYQRDSIGDNPSLPPTWTHRSSSNKINLGITVNTGVTTTSSSSNAITSSGKNSLTSPRQLLAKKKQNSFVEITQNLPIAGSPSSLRRSSSNLNNTAAAPPRTSSFVTEVKSPSKKSAWDENIDFTLDSDAALWAFEGKEDQEISLSDEDVEDVFVEEED